MINDDWWWLTIDGHNPEGWNSWGRDFSYVLSMSIPSPSGSINWAARFPRWIRCSTLSTGLWRSDSCRRCCTVENAYGIVWTHCGKPAMNCHEPSPIFTFGLWTWYTGIPPIWDAILWQYPSFQLNCMSPAGALPGPLACRSLVLIWFDNTSDLCPKT